MYIENENMNNNMSREVLGENYPTLFCVCIEEECYPPCRRIGGLFFSLFGCPGGLLTYRVDGWLHIIDNVCQELLKIVERNHLNPKIRRPSNLQERFDASYLRSHWTS